ncbi:MAG: Asp23/Gls24 family envelope stress response protein [Breznakia sp.]
MAQEYIAMKTKKHGTVALSTNVFTSIAHICVAEEGNVEVADNSRFKSNVIAKVSEDKLIIDVVVKLKYLSNVQKTCAKLQHNIFTSIKNMCDIETEEIDIRVSGFDFKES